MAESLERIRYCPRCGAGVMQAERFGRLRPVCPQCNWIFFADPKVAAAALVEKRRTKYLHWRSKRRKKFWLQWVISILIM